MGIENNEENMGVDKAIFWHYEKWMHSKWEITVEENLDLDDCQTRIFVNWPQKLHWLVLNIFVHRLIEGESKTGNDQYLMCMNIREMINGVLEWIA